MCIHSENLQHTHDDNYNEPLSSRETTLYADFYVCVQASMCVRVTFLLFLIENFKTFITTATTAISTKDSSKSKICDVNVRAKMNMF